MALTTTMPAESGTPTKLEENQSAKVVALYRFQAIENGDLSMEKGAEYEVIDDSQKHWWKVKDESGNRAQMKHYHIQTNSSGKFYLSAKHCCDSIPELIKYHQHNSGGLCSRLKGTLCDQPTEDKWEINPSELQLTGKLGVGNFGKVYSGKWRGSDVAVKVMKEGAMSEDEFIAEAQVMTKLQHAHLVQLYGVCSKHRPIYIVTEYMRHGSLHNYLRQSLPGLIANDTLLDICIQVADFGLARCVLDDQYTSSCGAKLPVRWAPPEVITHTKFSSKSDVWSFGVLMWEIFTYGKKPYGLLSNTEVVEIVVNRGKVLGRPKECLNEVYSVMRKCWKRKREERPSFRALKELLALIEQSLATGRLMWPDKRDWTLTDRLGEC